MKRNAVQQLKQAADAAQEHTEEGDMAGAQKADLPASAPWLMRTYAGHSSAAASNKLYRENLAAGQTGLSVAFDLPTQTGYDSDHPLAAGEVGKVGVPIRHIDDMAALFEGIPLDQMNTSMTINATAPWLLALYIAVAERCNIAPEMLSGTVQNDIIKEYLARGTYIFPPAASMKLTVDVIAYTYRQIPRWNPINICSYHLQEAGASPEQELAFALANAITVLENVRDDGQIAAAEFPKLVGRISFFVNAGMQLISEIAKMRSFTNLWDDICQRKFGVQEPRYRRFRYGVQVNSLGLTEQQPENNVYRILLQMLAVVMSKNARARAIQLPTWNEALGLPRPWDQQWSLRLQQVIAYETDLLGFEDIFDGSAVMAAEEQRLSQAAEAMIADIAAAGGMLEALQRGDLKAQLVASNAARLAAIENRRQPVVGVNCFQETAASPLAAGQGSNYLSVDPAVEKSQIHDLKAWRKGRDADQVAASLAALQAAARAGDNIMPPSIACAHAKVTTGEWADALRQVFGVYRPPTGVDGSLADRADAEFTALTAAVAGLHAKLGRAPKLLIGKPGLDGHSNGAEQIAVLANTVGFDVDYAGIRWTVDDILQRVTDGCPDAVGLSILSGAHMAMVSAFLAGLKAAQPSPTGAARRLAPVVVVGGIVPAADAVQLTQAGVAAVYTPKDFALTQILHDIVQYITKRH
jgi:(2R)-ethylmalonyl-CoA mutase